MKLNFKDNKNKIEKRNQKKKLFKNLIRFKI
jgi:hypothetical protein